MAHCFINLFSLNQIIMMLRINFFVKTRQTHKNIEFFNAELVCHKKFE